MTSNVEKFFNELLPAAMLKNPKYFNEIGGKYTFKITGEGGGEWSVNTSKSPPSVTQNDLDNSNCTLTMSAENFQVISHDPNAIMQLFFAGEITVSGDPMGLPKVSQIFK